MSVDDDVPARERYRSQREPCGEEFSAELQQISTDIADPVAKLRYLRGAIDSNEAYERRVQRVPCGSARRLLYRLRGLDVLDAVVGNDDAALPREAQARAQVARRRARRMVATGTAATLLMVPALLAGLALQIEPRQTVSEAPTGATLASVQAPAAAALEPEPLGSNEAAPTAAESLPDDPIGVTPSTIWLADRGPGWELYSNGLRIETTHTIVAEPRRYRIHDRKSGLQEALLTRPVGILFHTSESDLWPLSEDYGKQLRRSSASLLRYVQSAKAYNYLIDRFGRVYRVVDDDTRALHAGHSVWAHGDDVYLDLNSAFLGISFESRWEGGRTLPITRAQLIAGRNLTHYLRQRFAIAPEMCVTHGLASVSPRQHLIGYHRDWARGFPFAAFGLPDLYAQTLPSVALFGFEYDMQFVRAIGEPWPGLTAADHALGEAARERGVTVEALRQERKALYRQWSKQVRGAEDANAPAPAHHPPVAEAASLRHSNSIEQRPGAPQHAGQSHTSAKASFTRSRYEAPPQVSVHHN